MILKMVLNVTDEGAEPDDIEATLRSLVTRRDVLEPLMMALESAVPAVITAVTLESRFTSYPPVALSLAPEAIRRELDGDQSVHDPLDADSPSYQELANALSDEELFLAAVMVVEAEQTKSAVKELTYAVVDQAVHNRMMEGEP